MKELINPYGTEWHEDLENQGVKCAICGTKITPEYVLAIHGFPDPVIFCDQRCLMKFAHDELFHREGWNNG